MNSCTTIKLLINLLCKLIYWKQFIVVVKCTKQIFTNIFDKSDSEEKKYIKMDISLERDGNAIGSLFQQIINDMKVRLFVYFSLNIF